MRQLKTTTDYIDLPRLIAQRSKLERSIFAPNTQKAYAHDWLMFQRWCEHARRDSLPASSETVTLYLTDLIQQGRKITTAVRRTSGIGHQHKESGLENPVNQQVWNLLAGAQRMLCQKPRQMRPLSVEQLRQISQALALDGSDLAIRNRSILVLGFSTALRRASLADLLLSDIEFRAEGLAVEVRREKTDQAGKGRWIGVPLGGCPDTCATSCLRDWLAIRDAGVGPLFTRLEKKRDMARLSPATIGRAVKLAVAAIGLDPQEFAGHSLRSGFITEAGLQNVNELRIASQTGHRDLGSLRRYFRRRDLFAANACGALGL